MKIFLLTILVIINFAIKAQITKIDLQASGLTCSMCNKSIHKALTNTENVKNVETDLNTNTFTITVKDSINVDYENLKLKVEKAGYKVANFWIYINLNNIDVKKDTHINVDNKNYHFINVNDQKLNGIQKLQIVNKGFVSSKVFKSNAKYTNMSCYKTGLMENCCTNTTTSAKQIIYHLTK